LRLREQGIESMALLGGFEAWIDDGNPTEEGDPPK